MTCALCKYEFCWACGGSATKGDNHFGHLGGCGVKMMDENIKPGDHLKIKLNSKRKRYCWLVLCIVFFPIILVFYLPCSLAKRAFDRNRNEGRLALVCAVSCYFLLGLLGDLMYIPCLVVFAVLWLITCQFLMYCTCKRS